MMTIVTLLSSASTYDQYKGDNNHYFIPGRVSDLDTAEDILREEYGNNIGA